jgi:excisionase family DNA binding protein
MKTARTLQTAGDDRLLTLTEVAEFLQVKERTLYEWARKDAIPSFKLGNAWRFKKDDIDRWIEERKRKTLRIQSGGRLKNNS